MLQTQLYTCGDLRNTQSQAVLVHMRAGTDYLPILSWLRQWSVGLAHTFMRLQG